MRFRIGCVLIGLVMAVSTMATALAQVDQDPSPVDGLSGADAATVVPAQDEALRPALFLRIVDPLEDDVEVSLATTALPISGLTLSDAVVSVDGDLVDVDAEGGFAALAQLDEGANEIEIVASDGDGNQVATTLYVVRDDA
jgi:Glucodextranase, domain B